MQFSNKIYKCLKRKFLFVLFLGSNIYDDDGHVKKTVKPYTEDKEVLKYNHPLMLMVIFFFPFLIENSLKR